MAVPSADFSPETLLGEFRRVRGDTEKLAAPLSAEDQILQSMPDASPAKWHRAHTTWFFEAFILKQFEPDYRPFDERFNFLYNSYYEAMGARHPRPQRGLLSRPSVEEVGHYRAHVDRAMEKLIARPGGNKQSELNTLIVLGCHHEQQHQELLLTDMLHHLSCNPIKPAYIERKADVPAKAAPAKFIEFPGGLVEVGFEGDGFFYDNEGPRHKTYLRISPSRTAPSRTASGSNSCAMVPTRMSRFGFPMAGTKSVKKAGAHRCTGKSATGNGNQ